METKGVKEARRLVWLSQWYLAPRRASSKWAPIQLPVQLLAKKSISKSLSVRSMFLGALSQVEQVVSRFQSTLCNGQIPKMFEARNYRRHGLSKWALQKSMIVAVELKQVTQEIKSLINTHCIKVQFLVIQHFVKNLILRIMSSLRENGNRNSNERKSN